MSRWIAMHCGEEIDLLQKKHTSAFLQACQGIRRVRWKDCPVSGLKIGEALVGDWKNAGIRTEMAYRHAKKTLTKMGIATFRGTNEGTVMTFVDSTFFSYSAGDDNRQSNRQGTPEERPDNRQGTTKHTEHPETPKIQRENPPSFDPAEDSMEGIPFCNRNQFEELDKKVRNLKADWIPGLRTVRHARC